MPKLLPWPLPKRVETAGGSILRPPLLPPPLKRAGEARKL
jgi:hypothetical protein